MTRLFALRSASLRVRLCVWYIVFTFICMGCYGALLSQYLKYELRASREETMRRREHRFLTYMANEARLYPGRPLGLEMAHFDDASPENDLIEVLDLKGNRIYPDRDPDLPRPQPGELCTEPCLSFVNRYSHRTRVLTHRTEVAGLPVWLVMGGSVDEHYDIQNAVGGGYFLLLPFVLLGSVAGGFLLSKRALLPIGRMTEAAQKLSVTGLDGQLPVPQTGDELQELAEAWNDLLGRLEAEVSRSTQFTVDASHDLRTAVTVILANAELSLRRQRAPEQYREALNTIQQEAVHVITMLEEMLLAARSERQPGQICKEPVDLSEIVTDVCDACRAAATIKEIGLELIANELTVIRGDRALLRRMVSAVLDNAIKYTPVGGRVTIGLTRIQHGARLSIEDTGVGIAAAFHQRIFDRLYRVDGTRSRMETSGNGLGLSIARWIAEVHEFTLHVDSKLGYGAMFYVLIPEAALLSYFSAGEYAEKIAEESVADVSLSHR